MIHPQWWSAVWVVQYALQCSRLKQVGALSRRLLSWILQGCWQIMPLAYIASHAFLSAFTVNFLKCVAINSNLQNVLFVQKGWKLQRLHSDSGSCPLNCTNRFGCFCQLKKLEKVSTKSSQQGRQVNVLCSTGHLPGPRVKPVCIDADHWISSWSDDNREKFTITSYMGGQWGLPAEQCSKIEPKSKKIKYMSMIFVILCRHPGRRHVGWSQGPPVKIIILAWPAHDSPGIW